jgi:hypothetical protein
VADEVVGKPKKPIFKKWWFWVIVVVVVIAAASSGGGKDGTGTAKAPASAGTTESAPAAPEGEPTAKIGEPLKVGDLVFTVTDAQPAQELKSPLGDKKGNWMVVTVTVKNESKEAITVDSSFFKLIEGDGTTYETDSDNLMYLPTEQNFFLEKINPKLEKQGKALFAIPEGVTDFKLQVQTGAFGTETGMISLAK